MQDNQKKQVTDVVNAFRLVNKDIRESFKIMCDELESKNGFTKWKKWEKGTKKARNDYWDAEGLFDGENDWYYLNCYGMYNKKVVGFTFVISVDYDKNDAVEYLDFIDQLAKSINENTPMICIYGIYEPINIKEIKLADKDENQYVDDILQLTGDWKNYEKEKIKYNEWIDAEVDYQDGKEIKDGFEGWYKKAKIKIKHITDIASKEEAQNIIDDLIKSKI